jgi:hypothetical protein
MPGRQRVPPSVAATFRPAETMENEAGGQKQNRKTFVLKFEVYTVHFNYLANL